MRRSLDDRRWMAVKERTADADFVYGVSTTGIFCRPSCPSRRPNRLNVHFYSSVAEARKAGFRACLRCRPTAAHATRAEQAVEIVKAIIDSGEVEGTDLKSLAKAAVVSPFHLQRHFKRIVGMTPKAYVAKKKSTMLRKNLRKGGTVLRASFESGFNSASRAYSAATRELGMSPSAYRNAGAGVAIAYATAKTSFGRVIVGVTERGVCAVMIGQSEKELLKQLKAEFPKALITKGGSDAARTIQDVVRVVEGGNASDILLNVVGSPFQWKVWEALRKIPFGETRTYGEIARSLGRPGAARAVGRACATNRVAIVIPCHRVVRGDGAEGGYRWGTPLKDRLLSREANASDE